MGSGIHGQPGEAEDKENKVRPISDEERQRIIDKKRQFEAARESLGAEDPITSADSIAEDAMMNGGKVSEEPWAGEPEAEKENFVQEELYIHGKLLIADDRVVICGSSNINDRVHYFHRQIWMAC